MTDLAWAVGHHVIVFSLVGVLVAELLIVRVGMDATAVRRLARIDTLYGALAGSILAVGFARAGLAAKGWDYYASNAFFWAKLATFLAIGLLSIPPTLAYFKWRKEDAGPTAGEVARVKGYLTAELLLFVPLLGFAAAMARGFGMR
jgi:putative membrane protein